MAGDAPVLIRCYLTQRPKVVGISRAMSIIAGKEFHGDQITDARNGQDEAWNHRDSSCPFDDLGFDARRGEQQIRHYRRCRDETYRSETTCGVLLNNREDRVAPRLHGENDSLRLFVVSDGDCEIGVSRHSGFGSRRHRKSTDNGEAGADLSYVSGRLPKLLLDRGHDGFFSRGHTTERPSASPCGAPGRSVFQA